MVFYKKDKDGKKVLDKKQVAKGVLNAGKAISDLMRTAPAQNDPGYISMKRDNAPEKESKREIKDQKPKEKEQPKEPKTPNSPKGTKPNNPNGSTAEYSVDANGRGSLGQSQGNTYKGGSDTYQDYRNRRRTY